VNAHCRLICAQAKRRIANHPHYEDESIRHKTYQIHHWFAYRSIPDVHKILSGMQSGAPPCQDDADWR
jgi:hypothetical protein